MTPLKTTPKDFFLHLGATVALYASVIALINLSFSIINYFFPDQLAGYFYANSVAWPISVLVILVPILYVLENLIIRGQRSDPEKRNLWIRKWRIYLTLFLTGATVVGDLITLINTYLNGDITSRFVYKVLIVLFISSAIFKYYFFSVNENSRWANMAKSIIPWFGIVLVLVVIVTGFIVVGSPTKQRNIKFDNQRISDLQSIQWQVLNHWQQKGVLPAELSELNDSISGYMVAKDPQTEESYSYKVLVQGSVTDKTKNPSFELCADFALATQDTKGRGESGGAYYSRDISYPVYGGDGNDNWKHESGKQCFERVIDIQKYPVNTPVMPKAI